MCVLTAKPWVVAGRMRATIAILAQSQACNKFLQELAQQVDAFGPWDRRGPKSLCYAPFLMATTLRRGQARASINPDHGGRDLIRLRDQDLAMLGVLQKDPGKGAPFSHALFPQDATFSTASPASHLDYDEPKSIECGRCINQWFLMFVLIEAQVGDSMLYVFILQARLAIKKDKFDP
ncbi:hypothetical protein B0I35DRAFT_406379 [Stachybotrys elegans]|uniref:Uncharacterized protein n=1 Tax=Stachybotrys elegans TaxID=80388 RepID=A0A8K0T0X6_9HYPO|nr:hypothetical protein B0I35DRAFT_406379 [Stachybotrys elegans]